MNNYNMELERKYEEYERLRHTYLLLEAQKTELLNLLDEIDNALNELSNLKEGKKVYMLIGNILIEKDKNEVIEKLKEEKNVFMIKAESIKKQIEVYKEKLNNLAKELRDIVDKTNIGKK
ncbi:MAG: prefoldin subunit [Nanopusillaceae archaeon]